MVNSMHDEIYLLIKGKQIENFKSYTIDADLYLAEDAFSLELSNPDTEIESGMNVELVVNGKLELTGIIDKTIKKYDKSSGTTFSVSGRDLMGQVMDQYVDEFVSMTDVNLMTLAKKLIARVPVLNRQQILYQDGVVDKQGRLKARAMPGSLFDISKGTKHIEPGRKVGEVLMEYAKSIGLLFFSMPDGTFVFGVPASGGEAVFMLTIAKDGIVDVVSGDKTDDFSKRYKQVVVLGQRQGTSSEFVPADVNYTYTSTDMSFPLNKTFVQIDEYGNGDTAQLHANMLLQKMNHDSFRVTYKVPGHSNNNRNWSINELCTVRDEILGLNDNYLIYGRTFTMSKDEGQHTVLRLGYPGLMV